MGQALDRLLDHWAGHDPNVPFHADDLPYLESTGLISAFDRQLSPYPFVGNLREARIWVLMRNPSIGDADHLEEARSPLKDLIAANLARDSMPYPFLHLDPALDPSDAFNWWNRRRGLARLIIQLARELRITADDARRLAAQRIAILELCPYRSRRFPTAILNCKSAKLAKVAAQEAVHAALVDGRRGFVVPWKPDCWSLPPEAFSSVIRNQRTQGFTFRMGARSGFGEHIRRYAFQAA